MLQLPKSTTEILALKVLEETTDQMWVNWAVDMLLAGFDGEYLVELAGISPPYNGWEMDTLIAKVLAEQQLDSSNEAGILGDYICYLVENALAGESPVLETLAWLKDLWYHGSVPEEEVEEFMELYWWMEEAYDYEERKAQQWPKWWPWKRKKTDIDAIILEAFQKRQLQCRQGLTTPIVNPS